MNACNRIPELISDKDGVLKDPILYNDLLKITNNDRGLSLTLYRMVDLNFLEQYGGKLSYDSQGNPTLKSFLKIPAVKYIFDSKVKDVLQNLNAKFKSGVYTYEEAAQRAAAFNRDLSFNSDYLGTITEITLGKDKGKVRFSIVENSASERRAFEEAVKLRSFKDKLIYVLSNLGAKVDFVDELLDLEPGVQGVYSTLNPERVFDSLYSVIKVLTRNDERPLTEQEKLNILKEETGHLIVGIAENNPKSRLLFERLMNLLKRSSPQDIKNVLLATGHYTQAKADEIVNDTLFNIESNDNAVREAAGRIIAGLLDQSDGRLKHKNNYNTGKITRGLAAAAIGISAIPAGYIVGGALGAAVTLGTAGAAILTLSRKVRNAVANIFKLLIHSKGGREFFDLEGAMKKDDIIHEAKQLAERFMNQDLGTVLDALNTPEELHHLALTEARTANRIMTAFKSFIRTLQNSGLSPKLERALYAQIDKAVVAKNFYTDLGTRLLKNPSNVTFAEGKTVLDIANNYISSGYVNMIAVMLLNIQEVIQDMQGNILEPMLSDDFEAKLNRGEIDSNSIPDLNLKIQYQSKLLALIRLCAETSSIMNSVLGRELNADLSLLKQFHILELKDSVELMIAPIILQVNLINRETFAATLATVNGGHRYIQTSRRLLRDKETNRVYISDEVVPGLGRNQVTLDELLDGEANGVSLFKDSTAWGLWCLRMGANIDVINQMVSNLYDFNKAEANKDMYRYSLLLLDLHERIKESLGDEDTSFMCEVNKDGQITGNIVLPDYDYGSWEAAYTEFITQAKKDFKEANKKELAKKTEYQRGEALYEYLLPLIEEWHKKHSQPKPDDYIDELFDSTPFEEEGPRLLYLPGKEFANDLWSKLSTELKLFVREYIAIKQSLDNFVEEYHPDSITSYRLPQFRGTTISRMFHKSTYVAPEGERNKRQKIHDWLMLHNNGYRTLHDKFIENFFEDALDEDFGDNSCYNSEDDTFFDGAALTDGEYLRRIPVYGVNKLKDMHNLSTDLIFSTMQYAAMAINVNRMATTANILINGLNVLKTRNVGGISEGRKNSENTYVYRRYIKFLEMQVFNIRSNKFAMFQTKNGRTLLANKIMSWMSKEGSWWLLAGKIASGTVNTGTGIILILDEAAVGEHFTRKELLEGIADYFKYIGEADLIEGPKPLNRSDKYHSFIRYYDSLNNNDLYFRDFTSHMQLGKWSQLRRVNWAMWWYEGGNHLMQSLPYRLKGKHTKLYKLKDGIEATEENLLDSNNFEESGNVWDNFDEAQLQRGKNVLKYTEKREKQTGKPYTTEGPTMIISEEEETGMWGNPYLGVYYIKNPDGSFIPYDRVALARFLTQCRYMTDNMHGIYNNADALALSLSVMGASILTMKKYLFGYADKLFLTDRYSVADARNAEGAAITWLKMMSYYSHNGDAKTLALIYAMGAPILTSFAAEVIGGSLILAAIAALSYNFLISGGIASFKGKTLGLNLVGKIKNRMELDGITEYLRNNIKRFDTYMRIALMLRVMSMLLSNSLWAHELDDDEDKKHKKAELNWGEKTDAQILKAFGYDEYEEALTHLLTTEKGELKESPKVPGILYTIVEEKIKDETDKKKKAKLLSLRYKMGMAYYFLHRWLLESETLFPFDLNLKTIGEIKTLLASYSNLFPVGPSFMWSTGEAFQACFEPEKPVNYKYDKESETFADIYNRYGDWDEKDIPDLIYALRTGQHLIAGDNKGYNRLLLILPYLNSLGVFEDMYKGSTSYDWGRKMTTH